MSGLPLVPPAEDVECTVTLRGVKVSGKARDFTYVTTLISPEPELTIRDLGNGYLELAWRLGAVAYRLEAAAGFGESDVWSTVTNLPEYNGASVSVKVPSAASHRLFRLVRLGR
jgi:hypothetical protein